MVDKKIQYKVSLEPLNTPPIFTISKEGKITFGEAVKNYPHDEQAREFIKCVEQIVVNQPQGSSYQLGYDAARAEVIAEVKQALKAKQEMSHSIESNILSGSVRMSVIFEELAKLSRGAE